MSDQIRAILNEADYAAALARRFKNFFEFCDARKDRRDLRKFEIGLMRQQTRERGFACARWPPENQRAQRARANEPRQNAIGPDKMFLSCDIAQCLRTHAVSQRARRALVHSRCIEEVTHLIRQSHL